MSDFSSQEIVSISRTNKSYFTKSCSGFPKEVFTKEPDHLFKRNHCNFRAFLLLPLFINCELNKMEQCGDSPIAESDS